MMRSQRPAPWTFGLMTIENTPIRAHGLLLLFFAWIAYERLGTAGDPISEVIFILALLLSLVLHELAHLLSAKFFKVKTLEVVLYPFGGMSITHGACSSGVQAIIALAGPVANATLAILLSPWCDFSQDFSDENAGKLSLVMLIFLSNLLICLLNLIPVAPLDGAKFIQPLLSTFGVKYPALVTCRLGQVFGLLLFSYGLIYHDMLSLVVGIAAFGVASSGFWIERAKSLAGELLVSDVMAEKELLLSLPHGMTISKAFQVALKSIQPLFPVLHGEEVVGILQREQLIRSAAWDVEESYISSIMERDYPSLSPTQRVEEVIEFLQQYAFEALVVVDENKIFLGILFREKIIEFLVIQDLRNNNKSYSQQFDDEF